MLSALRLCPACDPECPRPLVNRFQGVCEPCDRALGEGPSLCAFCASPVCPPGGPCLRPWSNLVTSPGSAYAGPLLSGFHARYLMLGEGARVLRRWKTRTGPYFDRHVLNLDRPAQLRPALLALAAPSFFIVPIPQRLRRSWRLGRSPAEQISRWLASELGTPWVRGLRPPSLRQPHQAELSLEARLSRRFEFALAPRMATRIRGADILLVDDFMTTGRTLRAAALVLQAAGARKITGFSLAVRPSRVGGEAIARR